MTRPKTISDEDLLAVARKLFRAHGHDVTTRQVAESAGVSQAILFQRFGSKDELFFAAMAPGAPDLAEILGPEEPVQEARAFLGAALTGMVGYFNELLPLAIRLITHPSFDQKLLGRAQTAPEKLAKALIVRLEWFEGRRQLRRGSAGPLAQLLITIAHDWALSQVMSPRSASRRAAERAQELEAMIDVAWKGVAPTAAR
jgi:AcrR family transcriptional regulator